MVCCSQIISSFKNILWRLFTFEHFAQFATNIIHQSSQPDYLVVKRMCVYFGVYWKRDLIPRSRLFIWVALCAREQQRAHLRIIHSQAGIERARNIPCAYAYRKFTCSTKERELTCVWSHPIKYCEFYERTRSFITISRCQLMAIIRPTSGGDHCFCCALASKYPHAPTAAA
jgi:hypothetical protein